MNQEKAEKLCKTLECGIKKDDREPAPNKKRRRSSDSRRVLLR
ncbi:MAG: hypothetical protein AB1467_06675 [Candidatus Diapherotrites archaeon]